MSQPQDIVVSAAAISKKYCSSIKTSMIYGIQDIARNALGMSSRSERLRRDEFWAVDELTFEARRGEVLGIIGPNGSGKSTLLKMLSGIFWPDKGSITIKGRVASLIEVGAGFHPLLTGRENIYLNCAMLGLSKREVDDRLEAIIEFADLAEFIDAPVKQYSSGMFVRLGFSCMVMADPGVLILDEALAVGDLYFQQRCYRRLAELREASKTVLLVSHDLNAIRVLCDRVLLIDQGREVIQGAPGEVIDHYWGMTFKRSHRGAAPVELNKAPSVGGACSRGDAVVTIGTGEVELRSLKILNHEDVEGQVVTRDRVFKVVYEVVSARDLSEPHFGITINNARALQLYAANTYTLGMETRSVAAGETVRVEYEVRCLLLPGQYTVSIGVANKGVDRQSFQFEEYLLSLQDVASFEVIRGGADEHFGGIFDMKPTVTVSSLGSDA